jgi:hypothetical protein
VSRGPGRLSDTAALVRQGLRRGTCEVAPINSDSGIGEGPARTAESCVQGPAPGRFRRETGAGGEGLRSAVEIANEE